MRGPGPFGANGGAGLPLAGVRPRPGVQTALSMVYTKFGWDEQLGCPTAACLDEYGMADVKEELDGLGLLP